MKLDIRSIDINLDRRKFMHNPTNCAAQAMTGTINGGGSDPTNPAAFSSYPFSRRYQATGCNRLAFKPKLHSCGCPAPTKRAQNPRIQATLKRREGDANVARTALTLPHSLFLDQGHIGTVCTRPQLAAHDCPADSVYGHAEAVSPLLDSELTGTVYLVPSQRRAARPGRRPPGPGQDPAAWRRQLQARRAEDRVQRGRTRR